MSIRELSGYSKDPETVSVIVSGDDAGTFLQGQFSNDVNLLEKNLFQYSSYSTNQGKVIAIFRIFKDHDKYVILINKEISEYFIQKLSKYILMSKVTIEVSNDYLILGLCGKTSDDLLRNLEIEDSNNVENNINYWVLNNSSKNFSSIMLIYKIEAKKIKCISELAAREELNFNINKLSDYYNSLLRINMQTKEQYIPQVLNLEKLNGISYKKGCYTGQEIVARTHYLGKIKKKLLLISHTSDSVKIFSKVHDQDNEIMGEVMSENIIIKNELFSLAVIRLDSIKKNLYINESEIYIVD